MREPGGRRTPDLSIVVGLVANAAVILLNVPFLLIPTDKPIRPMIWPAFYILVGLIAATVGVPLSLRERRQRSKGGGIGMLLCLAPVLVGIASFWQFCWLHGVTVEP